MCIWGEGGLGRLYKVGLKGLPQKCIQRQKPCLYLENGNKEDCVSMFVGENVVYEDLCEKRGLDLIRSD